MLSKNTFCAISTREDAMAERSEEIGSGREYQRCVAKCFVERAVFCNMSGWRNFKEYVDRDCLVSGSCELMPEPGK